MLALILFSFFRKFVIKTRMRYGMDKKRYKLKVDFFIEKENTRFFIGFVFDCDIHFANFS